MPKLNNKEKLEAPGTSEVTSSDSDIGAKAVVYLGLKEKEKELSSTLSTYKTTLHDYVKANGRDYKGHLISVVSHAGREVELKDEVRKQQCLKVSDDPTKDALGMLKKLLSKEDFNSIAEVTISLNEDALVALHKKGKISDENLASLFEQKEVHAFKAKYVK